MEELKVGLHFGLVMLKSICNLPMSVFISTFSGTWKEALRLRTTPCVK